MSKNCSNNLRNLGNSHIVELLFCLKASDDDHDTFEKLIFSLFYS